MTRKGLAELMETFLGPGPAKVLLDKWDQELENVDEIEARARALLTAVVGRDPFDIFRRDGGR